MMKAFLLCCILTLPFSGHAANASDVKIVFLSEDVANGYNHRGGTPELLGPLENYVSSKHPENFVSFDVKKLLQHRVEPYYIFNKTYCGPIGKILGANTFVMARLVPVKTSSKPRLEQYNIQVKVYSALTGVEKTLMKKNNIETSEFNSVFSGNYEALFRSILDVASDK
ncbi:uncharacterized protein METZ01_LOCUS357548 [marine metagenome]|uniref:Uncharacterized protein n=1 Tax=marine metagenome TaxID=408172 RepID=A0A382S445_9ZZZZ